MLNKGTSYTSMSAPVQRLSFLRDMQTADSGRLYTGKTLCRCQAVSPVALTDTGGKPLRTARRSRPVSLSLIPGTKARAMLNLVA